MSQRGTDPFVIVIVGGGPRGTGILERLLANVGELLPSRAVRVEVVDPYPPGGGRVWRADQSELMWMNAVAENITMFTDETVRCAGPIRPGPSLAEWAASDGGCPDVTGLTFASRRIQHRYLGWVFDRVVAGRPPNVSVHTHATLAVGVDGGLHSRQRVWLRDRAEPIHADVVILAMGHLDAKPDKDERWMADFAARHDLRYLPRAFSVDADLSVFRPGERVVLRGFGLAFVDLMVLLTEGRGGRYHEDADGVLHYQPCGAEPVLYVGSRRGVPYRAKFTYRLPAELAPLPTFFDAAAVNAKYADRTRIDFRTDLWPAMAKEVGWGYYHQLFTAHPDRTTVDWAGFAAVYRAAAWDSVELRAAVERAVPDPADRLDLAALDRPLDGRSFPDADTLQHHLRAHVEGDLARRGDPAYSADLAAFHALLSVYGQMADILATGKLSARSACEDVAGWWQGFFEYFGSGPPSLRLRQLLALSHAGVVRFLGADMRVTADEDRGVFRAGSASTGDTVDATALVEARLPAGNLRDCTDALLRGMYERGAAAEHIRTDDDGYQFSSGLLHVSTDDFRVLDRAGRPHPRRYALGPYTNVSYFATFARPRVNALSFRQNDRLARSVLTLLGSAESTGTGARITRQRTARTRSRPNSLQEGRAT